MKKVLLFCGFFCFNNLFSNQIENKLSLITPPQAPSFWKQSAKEALSPFQGNQKYILMGSAIASLGYWTLDHNYGGKYGLIDEKRLYLNNTLGDLNEVGNYVGALYPNLIYAGSHFLAAALMKNSLNNEKAWIMLKSTLIASSYTWILKLAVGAKRPNGGPHSFPSGHTTTAFAFASVVGMQHSLRWSVPAYALAILAAVSRIHSNKHYVQDVILGMGIGISTGIGVSLANRGTTKNSVFNNLYVLPTLNGASLTFLF